MITSGFEYVDPIVDVSLRLHANDRGWIQVTMAKPGDVDRTLAARLTGAALDQFVEAVVAARSAVPHSTVPAQPSNEGDNHD